jgi:phage/plasmid-associated DNA primase
MARKKNSRMVISTEPEGDVILKSSTIKNVSGNDPQQVRELYGVSFNFIPKFKLIIQTNSEPTFHAFDGGMKRRITVINFPNNFVENPVLSNERKIDKTLKKKITIDKLYRYEFLEILIEHYKLYLQEGLIMPERIKRDTDKCIRNNDPVGEWYEANINKTNNEKDIIRASKLYENYIDFMDNDDRGISQLMFKNLLSSYGINQKKKSDGNYFTGIKFKVFRKIK